MLRVALDFDNVLADTTGAWIRYYNKTHNKTVKKSDFDEYYFWKSLHISKDEAFRIFALVWVNWKELSVIEKDSISIINEISTIAEIDLVTSALTDIKDWTIENKLKVGKKICQVFAVTNTLA